MSFHDPWILGLLALLAPLGYWLFRRRRAPAIVFPDLGLLAAAPVTWRERLAPMLPALTLAALACFVVGAARPQLGNDRTRVRSSGVDIVLALDRSGSMQALDFAEGDNAASRLDVVKDVVARFVAKRHSDRIGMTTFAGYATSRCPLTLDYGVLDGILKDTQFARRDDEDGTAIGDAIGVSTAMLKDHPAKTKLIVLLSDGDNNAGIDPLTASALAKSYGIKIYTIGVGHTGMAPFPARDPFGHETLVEAPVHMDEDTLEKIAESTGGAYWNARDRAGLEKITDDIDKLEKSQEATVRYTQYREAFAPFVIAGLALLLLEAVASRTYFRSLP